MTSNDTQPAGATAGRTTGLRNRWVQMAIGVLCMGLIANLQYAWTLFVNPIETTHHWGLAAVETTFSIFIVLETWLSPVEGWLVDKFGPRMVVAVGGICAALGWVGFGYANSLPAMYAAAVVTGIGAGSVYGTCVGSALKWFPDRRGLASGVAAAGFGSGAALSVIPIAHMIQSSGYEKTFVAFGLFQGGCIFLLAMLMVRPRPPEGVVAKPRVITSKVDFTTGQMVRTPVFWVMYAMFVAVATGGLLAAAQIGPIATDYGLASLPVSVGGWTLPLLSMSLAINNLCNGFTRPVSGYIADRIGRENTMAIFHVGEGLALLGLMAFGHQPAAFMVFSALVFLFWGEIFSGFPALCGDTFGAGHAAANAGTLYTAKGMAALLVPVASVLAQGGHWGRGFVTAAVLSILTGLVAKFVLAPMRRRSIALANQEQESAAAGQAKPIRPEAVAAQ
jgi:OFA family oxalate/formate antiporter-like MFS transporter